ncbi:MAG: pyrimidine 5'-nucleotidase [Alphaproteobacteria bacterium HGW-Alphaproteobacteria-6]|nr:MAG: pyrimidine 5'-nucleotidase [Alphaproteobacteria bacterium HGW-Alphaproteobacteria-6]
MTGPAACACRDLPSLRGWVFDLDNTLYPPGARLFDQIEVRMTDYVMAALGVARAEADRLRDHYWQTHGTTLAGLMAEHGLDPLPYLVAVHDIALDALTPDPHLRAAIAALPGRRIVHTNGSAAYAERVIAARGLAGVFDAVYGVEDAGFRPKPQRAAHEAILALAGIAPNDAAMFEDDARNLAAPHAMGMHTVHVAPAPAPAAHVHQHTGDLTGFLARITGQDWPAG